MNRIMFFIDGFNVYHSMNSYTIVKKGRKKYRYYKYRKYLWLNYRSLAEKFIQQNDTNSGINYFTAYATWKPHSMKRHRKLIDALKNAGVNVVMGKFKEKDGFCKVCGASFKGREEKQTDVNIALNLFNEALKDSYDTGVLMTNDTDLVPAIKTVKNAFPSKTIGVIFPLDRHAAELKQVCDFWINTKRQHLSKSQFSDQISLPNG